MLPPGSNTSTVSAPGNQSAWTRERVIEETILESEKQGADPTLVLAVFQKEAGLNPGAIGDSGSSFGLRMLHRGGQLGTHAAAWALDPRNSIPEGVAALKRALNGAQAAQIQKPANPAAYASDVSKLQAQWAKVLGSHTPHAGKPYKWSPLRDQIGVLAKQFGLTQSSGDRTPANNPGVANSDHLTTKPDVWAVDYTGAPIAMAAFYNAVQHQFGSVLKQVLPPNHQPSTGPDVHIAGYSSWTSSGRGTTPSTTSAASPTAQQGGIATTAMRIAVGSVLLLGALALVVLGTQRMTGIGKGITPVPVPV